MGRIAHPSGSMPETARPSVFEKGTGIQRKAGAGGGPGLVLLSV